MLGDIGKKNIDILEVVRKQEESHLQMVGELGKMGSALANIEKVLTKTNLTNTQENIVLQTFDQPFAANNYLYNSLIVGDAAVSDNAKLVITLGGVSYTTPLAAGDNSVNMPDGCMFHVTTTSGKPVTAILTRYNTPGNNDTNVQIQNGGVEIYDTYGAPVNASSYYGNGDAVSNNSNKLMVENNNMGFNGSTWDRVRSGGNNADAIATSTLGNIQGLGFPFVFNGTTWDRLRNAGADAQSSTGLASSGQMVYNGATWDRAREATGDALAATGIPGNGNLVYNGTTWDRAREATGDGLAATGLPAGAQFVYNGTTWDRARGVNSGDGSVTGLAAGGQYLFNGATWDRARNIMHGNLLASGARTVTTPSANQTNYNAKGVQIIINVTAASGTGGLTPTIWGVSSSGYNYQITAAPGAITATGVYVYEIYPGSSTVGGFIQQKTSGTLPRTWFVNIAAGDSSSYTYVVDYCYIT